jgi:hypothetical protein
MDRHSHTGVFALFWSLVDLVVIIAGVGGIAFAAALLTGLYP